MERLGTLLAAYRVQYLAFGLLSFLVTGFAGVLVAVSPRLFRPYVGGVDPMLAVLGVVLLGFSLWTLLLARGWFVVYEPGSLGRALPLVVLLPTLLAAGMALVDLSVVLPEDLNVTLPRSLLFYPTMGFVVGVLFHLLPLSVLLLVVTALGGDVGRPRVVWTVVVLVSLLEPIFQVQAGFSGDVPRWVEAYVGANVFAVNVAQLYLLGRYDFLTAYAFRLVYYLHWHVLWGTVRLGVLF